MSYASGMYTLLHLATLTLTVLALARVFSSVKVRSIGSAVAVAVVFSLLNFFLGWLIRVALFLPAILTLGLLFLVLPFIVNTILLWLTDKLLGSFEIDTLGGLFASAAVITVVNGFFHIALHANRMGLYNNPHGVRWI
ncbi:MAG TPA: phage holin family protein [Polyangia bacterium]|nr:phage holin family protein [Polyangia bacterium]